MCTNLFADGTFVNRTLLVVCQSQAGEIYCQLGSFLYINEAVYGHNENATQQDSTEECPLPSVVNECSEITFDILPFTTEQSIPIPNIQVPRGNITCENGSERAINYAQIEHMCTPGTIVASPSQ